RALDQLLPESQLVEVESGHFAHLEQPGAVAAAITGRGV
ncbi:MAG: hypothetical protein QOI19_2645, partial [Thermoleophilaceae bacterium]|nr:hypothetical protein [Thermoleophilaceae bacterium]